MVLGARRASGYLALSEEGVHDGSARGYERRLEHVGQEAKHSVEAFPLAALLLDLDPKTWHEDRDKRGRERERQDRTRRK